MKPQYGGSLLSLCDRMSCRPLKLFGRRAGALVRFHATRPSIKSPPSTTIPLRLATASITQFKFTITVAFILRSYLQLTSELPHYRTSSYRIHNSTDKQPSHITMPRMSITALLGLRVTCKIMRTNPCMVAPLPVDESDVESGAEDVPSTKAELAEKFDEPAEATMKDKGDEDNDDDDDDDPETSVLALVDYRTILTTAQLPCGSHQGPPLGLRRCEELHTLLTVASRSLI